MSDEKVMALEDEDLKMVEGGYRKPLIMSAGASLSESQAELLAALQGNDSKK